MKKTFIFLIVACASMATIALNSCSKTKKIEKRIAGMWVISNETTDYEYWAYGALDLNDSETDTRNVEYLSHLMFVPEGNYYYESYKPAGRYIVDKNVIKITESYVGWIEPGALEYIIDKISKSEIICTRKYYFDRNSYELSKCVLKREQNYMPE